MADTQNPIKIYDQPIVVAGATGKQGGAVVRRLLERGHRVRALTRNPAKPAAAELAQMGAEVVAADLEERSSLDAALKGAGAVFSVQDFLETGVEAELRQGLNLTEAASAAGIGHIVYSGASTMAARCLEFLVLTACRSGEALGATWQEVDLESRLWTIPGDRMKASKTHRIPLSEGAMGVLHPLAEARHGDLVFPGQKPGRPLSSMAMTSSPTTRAKTRSG